MEGNSLHFIYRHTHTNTRTHQNVCFSFLDPAKWSLYSPINILKTLASVASDDMNHVDKEHTHISLYFCEYYMRMYYWVLWNHFYSNRYFKIIFYFFWSIFRCLFFLGIIFLIFRSLKWVTNVMSKIIYTY